jgi:alkanesulfonate monooxygenase SsuD/methylene tetrahydromethanopterin reductase-like flavin-dependent oxidoreductase (luciferase family)
MAQPRRQPYVGIILPNYGPALDAEDLIVATQAAEASGFDSAWVTDHVAVSEKESSVYGTISEALVTMGVLIGKTSRIRIGVSALIIPQREAILTLKQLVSLDYLSGGRIIVAVAPGWVESEFNRLGAPFTGRGRRLDAWLEFAADVQPQMPGPIEHAGLIAVSGAWMAPAPAQRGGIEFWIAGSGAVAVRRAARLGVWHPVALRPEQIRPLAEQLRALRADARVILRIGVRFSDAPNPGGTDERGRHAIAGPPAWVAEQLRAYQDSGCDGFLIALDTAKPGLEERIRRFREEVLADSARGSSA